MKDLRQSSFKPCKDKTVETPQIREVLYLGISVLVIDLLVKPIPTT